MKKALALIIIITVILISPGLAKAEAFKVSPDFAKLFDEHGSIMMLIEPQSGSIVYANQAAASFYGYTKEQLLAMKITGINTLTPEETEREMQAAAAEDRNFFKFEHRLADGAIAHVEVFSYPVRYGDREVLFSIIQDVTAKTLLEEREENMTAGIIAASIVIIILLLLLVSLLIRSRQKLTRSKNELSNSNELRKTFIDADNSLVYLKDEKLRYVFVNKALEDFYQLTAEEIIGADDYVLTAGEFAEKRRQTDWVVLDQKSLVVDEVEWQGRVYKTTKFPVRMLNGSFGVGAYITDITAERENEKKREKVLHRHMIVANVLTRSFQNRQEQLDYVLHEALKLTESQYGYIYLYDEEKQEFSLNSWTRDVMAACAVAEKQSIYQLENTGLWGEVVRQRKAIVINEFEKPHPLKKGYPAGHVVLKNLMSIPVIIDERIMAVVGVANKDSAYDDNDVYETTLLMNGVWNAVERREALEKLSLERNKYLQTILSIGDGVLVVDKNGKVEMLNPVAEHLTGWPNAEALGKHYKDIFVLSHELEGFTIKDPIEEALATDTIQELGNHAILTARNGTKYYLEDSAAPIKDDKNTTMGVVLVFRDVTDKKKQRKEIEYLSFHDSLTGLYNRRFFEEELTRLDTARNLPLSVIMGDVNGLKLTNDIFGHAFGDLILKKVADVLGRVCRAEDIIARWGGDEFVILLPRTKQEDAEQISERIKTEFSKEQIKAIKGSISMGTDTKLKSKDSIKDVLTRAEEKMYSAKTLESSKVQTSLIKAIITTLHENSSQEKEHSLRVSNLCEQLGRVLNLSEGDIRKLKEAGYLHDIGKIVLDSKILTRNQPLNSEEWVEMKKHPISGFRILNTFDDTVDLAEAVLAHHERWDGSGYPKGLKEEEIPLLARIISLAERYDQMLHYRYGNETVNKTEVVRAVRENAGTRFDPRLAELFARMVENNE